MSEFFVETPTGLVDVDAVYIRVDHGTLVFLSPLDETGENKELRCVRAFSPGSWIQAGEE